MGVVRALRDDVARSDGRAIPSDEALVVAARSGQLWAQEALYRRYARMAAGLAHRLLASGNADVDDLVQDAFIAALTRLDSLREPEAFGTWLGSIVVRTATKRLRSQALRRRLGLLNSYDEALDPVASRDAPADVQLELSQVYGLLAKLRPEERVALVLRRVDGLSIGEIAEHMDLSLSTVKRRLRKAEARLERARERSQGVRPPAPERNLPTQPESEPLHD